MADKNKVLFGISHLHVGTYTADPQTGEVTMGQPYHQIGARNLSLDAESDSNDFYADNVKFWSGFTDNGFTGSIEVAKFDRAFKTQFLGYKEVKGGGIASVKSAVKPDTYIAFQTEGNVEPLRVVIYNVAWGAIAHEYATIEDTKEPQVDTIDITATGDNNTGITVSYFEPGDEGYEDVFTNPPKPAFANESE